MQDHQSILIVDDDEMTRELIAHSLRQKGFEATAVGDGLKAVLESSEHRPGLILLDVMLPDLSGLEVLNILRVDLMMTDIPVIFMSRLGHPKLMRAADKLGATDYIVKPFRMEQLLEKISCIPGFKIPVA